MMAPESSRIPKLEKVIGTEITPEINALGDCFGSSPLGKMELERGLLPLFATAARDQGVDLARVVLSSDIQAVQFYHGYCEIGANWDFKKLTHDDFVTVSKEEGLQLTADGAAWVRERIGKAITKGSSGLESFRSI